MSSDQASSKAVEAFDASHDSQRDDETVPAYDYHRRDDLYSDPVDRIQPDTQPSEIDSHETTMCKTAVDGSESTASGTVTPQPSDVPAPVENPPAETLGSVGSPQTRSGYRSGPTTYNLDGQLIFPGPPPCNASHALKFALRSEGLGNKIFKVMPRASTKTQTNAYIEDIKDKELYDISSISSFGSGNPAFAISGKRQSVYRGEGKLKRNRSLGLTSQIGKQVWECTFGNECKLKSRHRDEWIEWLGSEGQVIARERKREREKKGSSVSNQEIKPELEVLRTEDEKVVDLLITVWCAKLWFEETENLSRESFRDEGNLLFQTEERVSN
jgi:hypothetical protein